MFSNIGILFQLDEDPREIWALHEWKQPSLICPCIASPFYRADVKSCIPPTSIPPQWDVELVTSPVWWRRSREALKLPVPGHATLQRSQKLCRSVLSLPWHLVGRRQWAWAKYIINKAAVVGICWRWVGCEEKRQCNYRCEKWGRNTG